jgi:hypothetical protein
VLGTAVRADRVALDLLLLRQGQAVQGGPLGGDQLAQGVLVVGKLGLERHDPVFGALQFLLDVGQLVGVGEQLCGLRIAGAGQLEQQRALPQDDRGIGIGQHAGDRGRTGVLEGGRGDLGHGDARRLELGVGVIQVRAHLA